MSYIINKNNPFVNTKLTEKGRMKLAKGQLTFKYWAVGDSELNYGFEEIRDANPDDSVLNGKSILFKPKDNQPNIKYFVSKGVDVSPLNPLLDGDVKVIKAVINNKAPERGFFDETKLTKSGTPYMVSQGTVDSGDFTGTNTITLDSGLTVGNYLLFKFSNTTLGVQNVDSNVEPTPHLWYKIEANNAGVITLDRPLPSNLGTGVLIPFLEYASGELYENGMANSSVAPYWDVNTLSFDDSNDITTQEVPMWNMNNIWAENVIGLKTDTAEEFYKYGSNDMIGIRSPFLCYIDTISANDAQLEDICVDASAPTTGSMVDADNRAISVIHYTNNEISNLYGEFLYVDDTGKNVEIEIPDMMYHRRKFAGGSGSGDMMGMTFISDGSELHKVKNSGIEYYNLIEDPTLVNGDPKIVGKVLPHHHTIIFDNEEIVAALSYKSGRNWTLPELKLSMNNPTTGIGTGLLSEGETIYVTYVLENTSNGLPYNLPCQTFTKITNNTSGTKDISFTINAVDELPYMRKIEAPGYDGRGFSANQFKVLYQILGEGEKLQSDAWKEVSYTSTTLTGNINETIDPSQLENQLPESNNQKITSAIDSGAVIYEINDKLNLPNNVDPEKLQFGDERFFYGNVRTHIGATVYKTVFDVKVSANEFIHTTNPTINQENSLDITEVRVSEVGIYDNEKNLVFIGKLSEPIKLINGNTVTIELSMDF
jgi:hypothetical protein